MAQRLSALGIAQRLKVSHVAVLGWAKRGIITPDASGRYDLAAVKAAREARIDPRKGKGRRPGGKSVAAPGGNGGRHRMTPGTKGAGPGSVPCLRDSLERKEAAKAAREELLLAKLRGDLVEWLEVERAGGAVMQRARDLILAVPGRIADRLAATTDAAECRRLLDAELRRCCEELALPASLAPK